MRTRACFASLLLTAACGAARTAVTVGMGPGEPGEPGSPAPAVPASSTSAAAAESPPAPTRRPALTRPFGGERLLLVGGVAPDGSWVVTCSREPGGPPGKLAAELHLANETRPIRGLLAADETGRWLAVEGADGQRWLLDLDGGAPLLLDPRRLDLRDDTAPFSMHRALALRAGQLLALRAPGVDPPTALLTHLATGVEREVALGAGDPWRLQLSPDGLWVHAQVVTTDVDGNGRKDWPAPPRSDARPPCHEPVARFRVPRPTRDSVEHRLASTLGGDARAVPGFLATLGDAWLRRGAGGELLREAVDSTPVVLAPPDCNARLLHASGRWQVAIVACLGKASRPELALATSSGLLPLGISLSSTPQDQRAPGDDVRLFALFAGPDAVLVDLQRREVVRLGRGEVVRAVQGARALVQRDKELLVLDADTGSTVPLARGADPLPSVFQAEDWVVVTPHLIDLAAGAVVGKVEAPALGLTRSGSLLLASGPGEDGWAQGPLSFRAPPPPAGEDSGHRAAPHSAAASLARGAR